MKEEDEKKLGLSKNTWSKDNLVGDARKVKPKFNPNLVQTEIYELITQETYGTTYSFNKMRILPGGSVKEQSHADQHAIFILDGECEILLGDQWVSVEKGQYVYIPPDMRHSFVNSRKTAAEVLILKI